MSDALSIFELLDGRSIVFACEDGESIVTWNRSLTLQFWTARSASFREYHVVTLSERPSWDDVGSIAEDAYWTFVSAEAGDDQ